jgi:hypothetical protein
MKNNLICNRLLIYSKMVAILVCAFSLFFLISGFGVEIASAAEPLRLSTTSGGDCAACHGTDSKLPTGHTDTKGIDLKPCLGCHGPDEP